MMDSRFNTLSIPQRTADYNAAAAATTVASLLAEARSCPLRIVVRNISLAAEAVLSFDQATFNAVPFSVNTYTLPAGVADTFMLAVGQRLYAASTSALCKLSLAISEALPVDAKP